MPFHDVDDRDRVARAQAGDAEALDDLVGAARVLVIRYAHSRLCTYDGGAEAAEDVTQDVCLALVVALPRYRDTGAPFSAFVHRIAAHKVADARRRYGRSRLTLVGEVPETAEPAPGPEDQALIALDVAVARDLLARIPPRMALMLRMRAEGMTADEVASALGSNPNTVRVTQHRAIIRLRELVAAADGHHAHLTATSSR